MNRCFHICYMSIVPNFFLPTMIFMGFLSTRILWITDGPALMLFRCLRMFNDAPANCVYQTTFKTNLPKNIYFFWQLPPAVPRKSSAAFDEWRFGWMNPIFVWEEIWLGMVIADIPQCLFLDVFWCQTSPHTHAYSTINCSLFQAMCYLY